MNPPEQQKPLYDELDHIPNVLSFFSVGRMRTATRLTGGDANHNYLVTTQKGPEFIVKFPIEQTRESLINDVAIGEQLAIGGIGSSAYLHRTDRKFIYDEGPMAVISTRINGVHPEVIDKDVSSAIGNALARFHAVVTNLPNPRKGWLNPETVVKTTNREDNPLIQQARRFLIEGASIYSHSLPSGIIYGDLHEGNLLVHEDDPTRVVALFDFEEAEENLYIIDISRTMLSVCTTDSGTKLDMNLMQAFVHGHSSVRQLTKEELENLPNAIKWCAGAAILWYVKNGLSINAQNAISRVESLRYNYMF